MAKFKVHFDVRRPDGKGGISSAMEVNADLEFTAIELARAQFFATHRNQQNKNYAFVVKRVEKRS